ncbi:MAG: molybdopterin molybdotransferase MoeA [Rhodospirillaceae bacterium]|nr:molybdopterin molybdotransferase MoeA [Rhodospirillaceae bacterium]MBT6085310.1 molybdopterin molybdotransferase MoeA [Rhodospirillaceae bacterium]MBT7510796.1 molybdopterin molybdotransferase MoeA [Rhodospirillaceae bacterium]
MAQLKDDCFAFGGELMALERAMEILKNRIDIVAEPELVSLRDALGRILAEDIASPRDVPPHDNSAVDGYAVCHNDLLPDEETRLPVSGRVAAGHPLGRPAKSGEAVRIFTGAPMPDGMETVFMEEDCTADGNTVILPPGLKSGANRRKRGEDIEKDDIILRRGQLLRPQELGLAASVGRDRLRVYRRLRAAVFSTGDEVCDPSGDSIEGGIYDANRFAIMGLLDSLGCIVTDLGILPDDQNQIATALQGAVPVHDIILTSGGVSAGEEDHVKAAVEQNGTLDFWRLAIKPGRPIALGQVKGTAFVGLPGNPVAAMVTFMVIARAMILLLGGATNVSAPRFPVVADFDYKKKSGRREWVRASIARNLAGQVVASKFRSSGAGVLTSMVAADGLVELPEDIEVVRAGEIVDFLSFNEVSR